MRSILLIIYCTLCCVGLHAQRGKNGNFTVTALATQVNAYTSLTANAAIGSSSISVSSNALTNSVLTVPLAAGDLILIIQMQGATMDVDPANVTFTTPIGHQFDWYNYLELWGQITAYNNAGKFEYAEVTSITGSTGINLLCGLTNSYTASGHVQIVRVPRFNDLTLQASSSIVPSLWDGTTGGVVVLEVDGNLTMNATSKISASAYGFRGGTVDATSGGPAGSATDTGFPASNDQIQGAEKGEGIGGSVGSEYNTLLSRYGKGAPANGGGGGNYKNAGGGGGSNIGSGTYTGKGVPVAGYPAFWNLELAGLATSVSSGGGRGGYSGCQSNQDEAILGPNNTAWAGDYRRKEGGFGGHPLTYDATRIFMGGGGGAGDMDQSQGGNGGRGGGIILIKLNGSFVGTGTMEANGSDGQNSNPNGDLPSVFATKKGVDGAGGGGAGGSISISNSVALPNTLSLTANGGKGGNNSISYYSAAITPVEADGPGGGGTGGSIAFSSGSPIQSANAGNAGIVVTGTYPVNIVANFPPNGATNGNAGIINLPVPYVNFTVPPVTICPNSSTTLVASITGILPGVLTWYPSATSNVSLGTGNSFTTPILNASTTYYVGYCPGAFRLPVTVTVGAAPTITGSLVVTVGNTITLTGSATPNASLPWVSGTTSVATISSTGVVTGMSSGTTTITYTNSVGCQVSVIVTVTDALPISILSFSANVLNRTDVTLNWTTEKELDVDHFEIITTSNGQDWSQVCTSLAIVDSTERRNYKCIDVHPGVGMHYYQLIAIDKNGQFVRSKVEPISFEANADTRIFPNPVENQLEVTGDSFLNAAMYVVNAMGQKVEVTIEIRSNSSAWIDMSLVSKGIYYLIIERELEKEMLTVIKK
jgi:hypothetical protein